MKRVVAVGLALLLSFSAVFALSACAQDPEAVIREGLSKELDELKNPNSGLIASALGELDAIGIDSQAFATAWLDGFDYSIGTITVTGDTAVAEVKITIKQLGPAVDTATGVMEAKIEDGDITDEQEAMTLFGDELNKALKALAPATTTIQIDCKKTGNVWEPTGNYESALEKAIIGTSKIM